MKNSTIQLQGLGTFNANLASEIEAGDVLVWNFGYKSQVLEIVKETAKTIVIKVKSLESDFIGERRLSKNRAVLIHNKRK